MLSNFFFFLTIFSYNESYVPLSKKSYNVPVVPIVHLFIVLRVHEIKMLTKLVEKYYLLYFLYLQKLISSEFKG